MFSSWVVLVPPCLVLVTAFLSRNILWSFIIGILSSALIATEYNPYTTLSLLVKRYGESSGLININSFSAFTHNWSMSIFLFLCAIGILIVLLQRSGSTESFVTLACKKVHGKKSTEITSLLLSWLFFIDDYFSAITVGSVMRPLAAVYGLSPIKLAFLVTAMASPLSILSPLSSWVGEIVLQLKQVGIQQGASSLINTDPFYALLYTIPSIFYAILLIIGTWYIVLRGISYGPMKKFEEVTKPNLAQQCSPSTATYLGDFIIPIVFLLGAVIGIFLKTGNCWLFGGTNNLLCTLREGSIQQAFFIGGILTTLFTSLYFVIRKKVTLISLPSIFYEGIMLMAPSILMLINVWALGALMRDDLQIGHYIATFLPTTIHLSWFAAMSFVGSALICFIIGSAWGTIGLLFPIIIPLFVTTAQIPVGSMLEQVPLLAGLIGAILSGSIMGTHISLIADNPLMAATSAGASHLQLVRAMLWYVLPVGLATAISYVVVGTIHTVTSHATLCALAIGTCSMLCLLELFNYIFRKTVQ